MKKHNQPVNVKKNSEPTNAEKWSPCYFLNPFKELIIIFTSDNEENVEKTAEKFQMRIQKLIFITLTLLLLAKGLCETLQTLTFFEQPIILHIPYIKDPLVFYKDNGIVGALLRIKALVYVAKALALSCGFQLAYMLVTKGPDEAVEPIMLGIASAILLILSDSSAREWNPEKSLAIFILIISIPILYWSSRKMKKDKDEDSKKGGKQ